MDMETQRERLRRIIADVERTPADYDSTVEDMTTAYRINSKYMVENHGIKNTARFLLEEKQKGLDEVVEYVEKALGKLNATADIGRYLSPPKIEISITDSFNTTVVPTAEPPQPVATVPPIADQDPHRFNKDEVYQLMDKLVAHERWAMFLDDANYDLKEKERGPIDAKFVAFVGSLWRKNIRQNTHDPGAVPVKAVAAFCKRDKTFYRAVPDTRQTMAACCLLEDVGFMKKVRCAAFGRNGNKGQCAAYQLLNEEHWDSKK